MLLDFENIVNKYNMSLTGVIHIGAHHGSEYKLYKKYNSIKNLVFFEPDPDSFKVLKKTIDGDEKATAIKTALGAFSCKAYMNKETANDGGSNSILEPGDKIMGLDLYSGGHLSHGFKTDKKKIISVRTEDVQFFH